jgi:hypothetical protein
VIEKVTPNQYKKELESADPLQKDVGVMRPIVFEGQQFDFNFDIGLENLNVADEKVR